MPPAEPPALPVNVFDVLSVTVVVHRSRGQRRSRVVAARPHPERHRAVRFVVAVERGGDAVGGRSCAAVDRHLLVYCTMSKAPVLAALASRFSCFSAWTCQREESRCLLLAHHRRSEPKSEWTRSTRPPFSEPHFPPYQRAVRSIPTPCSAVS